ncbi:MAG: hypothetical protein WCJ55_08620 [Chloroflexales bacterium]
MNILPFRVYLEQPVLIAGPSGDPNSVTSLNYLSGSLLRGVMIGRYLGLRKIDPHNNDLAVNPEARRLFFDGGVRCLNAYLLSRGGQRGLPTPLTLLHLKKTDTEQPYTAYNTADEEWNEEKRREIEREAQDQLKSLSSPYCTVSDTAITSLNTAPSRVTVHVQRDRVLGRATDLPGRGAIFQYEALSEGQWFAGALLIEQPDDLALMQQLLLQNKEAWLGRSRSANYGRVRIEVDKPVSRWREIGDAELEPVAADHPLAITLLSDVLLRDIFGVPVASLAQQPLVSERVDDRILSSYLGFEVQIDPARSFSAATLAAGFNQTWRLPLPQQPAIKAGSHFIVYPREAVSVEQLRHVEQRGIGERRPEGYGRIAFQWLDEAVYCVTKDEKKKDKAYATPRDVATLSATGRVAAQRMALRLLEQRIDLEIAKYVRDQVIDAQVTNLPRNSQLGRLRVLLRQARKDGNTVVIDRGMAQFKEVAHNQLANARLAGRSLRTWLDELLETDAVWKALNLRPDLWPKVAGVQPESDPVLTTRTTLRLIEAVLTGLHRKQRQSKEEPQA